ncbi:MAG: endonuclease/exonuclease/phosphatase family protein, partial [Pseudomonadota bacterium]
MSGRSIGKALCLSGIAIAAAGLVAGYMSRFWIELDVLRHLSLHFGLAIFALAIAYFAAKPLRVPVALLLMAAGMIAIGSWSKLSADQLQTDVGLPAGAQALTIMHFNIWGRNQQLEDVGAEVARLDPDILFLTEVGKRRQGLTAVLDQRFPHRLPEKGRSATSLLMYSKYPFTASQIRRRSDGLSFIRGTLGPEWQYLNVFGTHLNRPPNTRNQEQQVRAM